MAGKSLAHSREWEFSFRVARATVWPLPDLYRTEDGDTRSVVASELSGPNDIDDLCAFGEDGVCAVQNANAAGVVLWASLAGSDVEKKDWLFPFAYEGVSCLDRSTAWVVGLKPNLADPSLPDGSILHTSDGETWTVQPLPVDNAGPRTRRNHLCDIQAWEKTPGLVSGNKGAYLAAGDCQLGRAG